MLLPFLSHFSPFLCALGLPATLIYSAFSWLCMLCISLSFSSFFHDLFFVFLLSFSLTCFIFLSFFWSSFLFHFFSPFLFHFLSCVMDTAAIPFLTFVIHLYLQNTSFILQLFFSQAKYIHNFLPIFWGKFFGSLYILGSNL